MEDKENQINAVEETVSLAEGDGQLNQDKPNKRKRIFGTVSLVLAIIILLYACVYLLLYNTSFMHIYVDGVSMEPNLQDSSWVVANRNNTEPTYGDIVVIKEVGQGGKWVIKRVVAIAGDTVRIDGGKLYLKKSGESEFKEVVEDYIDQPTNTLDGYLYEMNIPPKYFFYLGDNRGNSVDSRVNGPTDVYKIAGVVEKWSITLSPVRSLFFNGLVTVSSWFGVDCLGNQ